MSGHYRSTPANWFRHSLPSASPPTGPSHAPGKRYRGPFDGDIVEGIGQGKKKTKRRFVEIPMDEPDEAIDLPRGVMTWKLDEPRKTPLACPFFKKDPKKYPKCLGRMLGSIRHVKRHLLHHHKVPCYCPVCLEKFADEGHRDQHVRLRSCKERVGGAVRYIEGITRDQEIKLAFMPKTESSEEEIWFKVFNIVFPNGQRPASAYMTGELHASDHGTARSCYSSLLDRDSAISVSSPHESADPPTPLDHPAHDVDIAETPPAFHALGFESEESPPALPDHGSESDGMPLDAPVCGFESEASNLSDWLPTGSDEPPLEPSHPYRSIELMVVEKLVKAYQKWLREDLVSTGEPLKDTDGSGSDGADTLVPSSSGESPTSYRDSTSGFGDIPLRGSRKRVRDDTDGSEKPLTKVRRKKVEQGSKRLACPFQKRYPLQHFRCGNGKRTGESAGFDTIAHIKGHLKRSHFRPLHYCPRCKKVFPEEEQKNDHLENELASTSCPKKDHPDPTALPWNAHLTRALHDRVDKDLSLHEQWFSIWDTIFPGRPRPRSCLMDDDACPDVQRYLHFESTLGPAIVRRVLADEGMPVAPEFDQFLERVFTLGIPRVREVWEAERRASVVQMPTPEGSSTRGVTPSGGLAFAASDVSAAEQTPARQPTPPVESSFVAFTPSVAVSDAAGQTPGPARHMDLPEIQYDFLEEMHHTPYPDIIAGSMYFGPNVPGVSFDLDPEMPADPFLSLDINADGAWLDQGALANQSFSGSNYDAMGNLLSPTTIAPSDNYRPGRRQGQHRPG